MINSKMIIMQAVVLVTIILCIRTAIGQHVPGAPAGCDCYSTGGSGNRAPCNTTGCSANSHQNCDGDVSLFLFYPNASDANGPNPTSGGSGGPSLTANRYGSCSCPGQTHTYGGSNYHDNAYYVTSGDPTSNPTSDFHNITSCNDFGNLAGPGSSSANIANATACCNACCGSSGD
jgi:hypothetical protein